MKPIKAEQRDRDISKSETTCVFHYSNPAFSFDLERENETDEYVVRGCRMIHRHDIAACLDEFWYHFEKNGDLKYVSYNYSSAHSEELFHDVIDKYVIFMMSAIAIVAKGYASGVGGLFSDIRGHEQFEDEYMVRRKG